MVKEQQEEVSLKSYILWRNWYETSKLLAFQWRHNEHDGVSNHQPRDCLLNRLFKAQINKKTSKLRVTGLCEGNSPVAGDFPAQRASNVENVSIWGRHHGKNDIICHEKHLTPANTELNHYKYKKNPWITMGIINSIKFRDKRLRLTNSLSCLKP